MNGKALFKYMGLFLLSLVLTEIISVGQSFIYSSFFQGDSGLPLAFESSSLFGGGSINFVNLCVDVLFWFIVLLLIWKIVLKLIKRS